MPIKTEVVKTDSRLQIEVTVEPNKRSNAQPANLGTITISRLNEKDLGVCEYEVSFQGRIVIVEHAPKREWSELLSAAVVALFGEPIKYIGTRF